MRFNAFMMYACRAVIAALMAARLGADAVSLQSIPTAAGKSHQKVNVSEKKHWPTIFVAIFSRRSALTRRVVLRDMWKNNMHPLRMVYRFALCQDEDSLDSSLKTENAKYGDLMIMECHEGYGHGMLTKKTLATMQEYNKHFRRQDLFMKIDDDTFAAWSRLWPRISEDWQKYGYHTYTGTFSPGTFPNRNPSSQWYEPVSSFPREKYPSAADGGPGYILGGQLVSRMLNLTIPEAWQLWNEDKAVGVWVEELVKTAGETVEYITLPGEVGYTATKHDWYLHKTYWHTENWRKYPLMLHHRLSASAISCLAQIEAKKDPDAKILHCFTKEDTAWIDPKF